MKTLKFILLSVLILFLSISLWIMNTHNTQSELKISDLKSKNDKLYLDNIKLDKKLDSLESQFNKLAKIDSILEIEVYKKQSAINIIKNYSINTNKELNLIKSKINIIRQKIKADTIIKSDSELLLSIELKTK